MADEDFCSGIFYIYLYFIFPHSCVSDIISTFSLMLDITALMTSFGYSKNWTHLELITAPLSLGYLLKKNKTNHMLVYLQKKNKELKNPFEHK